MNVTMRYCEGWDWAEGRAVGWLTGADAFAADCAGRPYTVLVAPADGPAVVIDVAWEADYLAVSRMDGEGRLAARTVYRRMREGELFPVRDEEWRFGPGERTGDPGVWHEKVEREPGGRTRVSTGRGSRGSGVTVATVAVDALWRREPKFGEWVSLTSFPPGGFAAVLEPTGGSEITGRSPWRPANLYVEPYLDALITPGASLTERATCEPGVVELTEIGRLRLPSGRVAVHDPEELTERLSPLMIEVPPGEYRVELATVGSATGGMILWLSGETVVAWEPAVAEGREEPYRFGSESAFACFVDVASAAGLAEAIEATPGVLDEVRHGAHEIWIDGEDVNLVAFQFDPGGYPVWVGRDADGAVVCVVADPREVGPLHG